MGVGLIGVCSKSPHKELEEISPWGVLGRSAHENDPMKRGKWCCWREQGEYRGVFISKCKEMASHSQVEGWLWMGE